MNSKRLAGQSAWISGAASGMGKAAAQLFAREGAHVTLVDIDAANVTAVADSIRDAGGSALAVPCDVSQESEVQASIQEGAGQFGGLQIVVNCAGVVDVGPLHEYSADAWDSLMGVNLKSIFFSLKHGISYVRQHSRSYMVNVGSVSGMIGQANTPAYIASKHAVLGLTRAIALDYAADGLRCNCICPGITDTPMLRYHMRTSPDPDAALRSRLKRVPIGVALTPEDIARSILYLACEDSAGITGTSLVIDGGYTATAEWENAQPTRFMD